MAESAGIQVIRLEGRLDPTVAREVETKLKAYLADVEVPKLVLNLEGVGYMGSAGVRVLLSTAKEVRKRGGGMALCSLSVGVEEVLKFAGLDDVFTIFAEEPEAVASLG